MSHSCRVQRASARPVRTAVLYPSTCADIASRGRVSPPRVASHGDTLRRWQSV
jgi:hypothetical protein